MSQLVSRVGIQRLARLISKSSELSLFFSVKLHASCHLGSSKRLVVSAWLLSWTGISLRWFNVNGQIEWPSCIRLDGPILLGLQGSCNSQLLSCPTMLFCLRVMRPHEVLVGDKMVIQLCRVQGSINNHAYPKLFRMIRSKFNRHGYKTEDVKTQILTLKVASFPRYSRCFAGGVSQSPTQERSALLEQDESTLSRRIVKALSWPGSPPPPHISIDAWKAQLPSLTASLCLRAKLLCL